MDEHLPLPPRDRVQPLVGEVQRSVGGTGTGLTRRVFDDLLESDRSQVQAGLEYGIGGTGYRWTGAADVEQEEEDEDCRGDGALLSGTHASSLESKQNARGEHSIPTSLVEALVPGLSRAPIESGFQVLQSSCFAVVYFRSRGYVDI